MHPNIQHRFRRRKTLQQDAIQGSGNNFNLHAHPASGRQICRYGCTGPGSLQIFPVVSGVNAAYDLRPYPVEKIHVEQTLASDIDLYFVHVHNSLRCFETCRFSPFAYHPPLQERSFR